MRFFRDVLVYEQIKKKIAENTCPTDKQYNKIWFLGVMAVYNV